MYLFDGWGDNGHFYALGMRREGDKLLVARYLADTPDLVDQESSKLEEFEATAEDIKEVAYRLIGNAMGEPSTPLDGIKALLIQEPVTDETRETRTRTNVSYTDADGNPATDEQLRELVLKHLNDPVPTSVWY